MEPSREYSPPVVEIRNLEKRFITEAGEAVPVFRGLHLQVQKGEFLVLLGPTGCGKTTLLRMLLGLEPFSAGEVRVAGVPPVSGRVPAGVVFQQNTLFPWKKVVRNVAFPLEMRGADRREAQIKALEFLRLVRLEEGAESYPYELSGGMQQRAALARALANEAGILFMDEPFGALDDAMRRTLQEVLLEIHRARGLTVLFVTHNIEEALLLGTRVAVMGREKILKEETVALPRPRDPLSPAFTEHLLRLRRDFAAAVPAPERFRTRA